MIFANLARSCIVSIVWVWATTSQPVASAETVVFDASFDGSAEGFVYADDTFSTSSASGYSSGTLLSQGARNGGGLQVLLGGQNNNNVYDMSGGWERKFSLDQPSSATLSFWYHLTLASDYESNEYGDVLASIDGSLLGGDYIARLTGNGNGGSDTTTGWQFEEVDLGLLSSGDHSLVLGCYNNQKTYNNEDTEVIFDDVKLTSSAVGDVVLEEDFTEDAGSFALLFDFFGTNAATYETGSYLSSDGGALLIELGGLDNVNVNGMSAAWRTPFVLPQDGEVTVFFDYRLVHAANYESDEYGQVRFDFDGTTDVVAEIFGNGNGGSDDEVSGTGVMALGELAAGTHEVAIGGYSNKKTWANEITRIYIENVMITQVSLGSPSPSAATPSPSVQPSSTPTDTPTSHPTETPSMSPSESPTKAEPSSSPTVQPSSTPTDSPTAQPSETPSVALSQSPTKAEPSSTPSFMPSRTPQMPSAQPSESPSRKASEEPTAQPSTMPSPSPSAEPSVAPSRKASAAPSFMPSPSAPAITVLIDADFRTGEQGFQYIDDAFKGTTAPAYEEGGTTSDGLRVTLGGIDNDDVPGMSGAWQNTFSLTVPSDITLTFRSRLEMSSEFEANEYSETLCAVDGTLYGKNGNDYVARMSGNGNGGGVESTEWEIVTIFIPDLGTGSHTVAVGGYNNLKTYANEISYIDISDLSVIAVPVLPSAAPTTSPSVTPTVSMAPSQSAAPSAAPGAFVLEADFNTENPFTYQDNLFRGTSESNYADGRWLSSEGFLEVELGGVDNANIDDMSGGWSSTFVLSTPATLTLSLRYRVVQSADYGSGELSQALCSVDGVLYGQEPFDMIAQLVGNGQNNGGDLELDWRAFETTVGPLGAGSHTLAIGGFCNRKSDIGETTIVQFDDVSLVVDSNLIDPDIAVGEVVGRLDLQDFKDTIKTLSDFGDRRQGSTSYNNAVAWLELQLSILGYIVEKQPFNYNGQRANTYVTKVGTRFPDRMFIVSAHLDGRGGGGGADDDASGCSLVFQMARVLADPMVTTDVSIRMIWWDAEEVGLIGSNAYVNEKAGSQGKETPEFSGLFPEPTWLAVIQHDMILYDHGLWPEAVTGPQIALADIDVEYKAGTRVEEASRVLGNALFDGNQDFAISNPDRYPVEVTNDMCCTDSYPFRNYAPSVSVRENRRRAEIKSSSGEAANQSSNPYYHRSSDVYANYGEEDFEFGFKVVQTTVGTVAKHAGVKVIG